MPDISATLRTWRSVLAQPHVKPVFVTTGIGRLARASVPLAVVLVVSESTGSYTWAGAAAAALTVADAVTAPLKGRLADRHGRVIVLLPGSLLYALALFAMAQAEQPNQVWILSCATIAGVGFPPISGSVKALLPSLVRDGGHLQAAYVLESTVQQMLFFAGPLYVATAASAFSSDVALYGAAASTVAGVAGFLAVVRKAATRPRQPTARRPRGGALAVPAVLVLTCTTLLQSIIFGANSVAVTASAAAFGAPNAAGLVLAAGPIGGLAGGLLIAPTGRRPHVRYVRMLLIAAACYAPMAVVPFPAIALCLFSAGLVVTPLAATCYLMLSAAAPVEMQTEAFTWLSTAVATGGAIGAAFAGLAADHLGVRGPLVLAVLAALAAALVGTARRSALV